MALAERKEGDSAQLQKVYDFNERLEQHIMDRVALAYEKAEPIMLQNNILNRLLICDSDGQHKLPKARRRLNAEDVEATEVRTVDVPLIPQGAPASDKDDYSIF